MKIETERLVLRNWLKRDLKPFASMNSDPVVMEFFPKMLSEDESNAMAANIPVKCSGLLKTSFMPLSEILLQLRRR